MRLCLPPAYLKHYWNIGKNQNISVSGCLNLKTQVSKAELISNTPYTNKAFNFVSVDFCTTHLQLCTKGENNARSEKFARAYSRRHCCHLRRANDHQLSCKQRRKKLCHGFINEGMQGENIQNYQGVKPKLTIAGILTRLPPTLGSASPGKSPMPMFTTLVLQIHFCKRLNAPCSGKWLMIVDNTMSLEFCTCIVICL